MTDQAMRFNKDKPQLSFMLDFPHAMAGVVRVLEFGAEKYERNNWQKGLPYLEVIDSMLRHLQEFRNSVELDPESELPHIDHVLCNALFLSEFTRTRPEFDNRNGPPKGGIKWSKSRF